MRHALLILAAAATAARAQIQSRVVRGDMIVFIPVHGSVEAGDLVRIRSPIDGRMETVKTSPNSWMRAEDPLGFMASKELAALLDSNHTTPEETLEERWKEMFPLDPLRCPADCYVVSMSARPKTWAHLGEVLFKAAKTLWLEGTIQGKVPAGQSAWPDFAIWSTTDPGRRYRVNIERLSRTKVAARLPFGSRFSPGMAWEGELEVHVKRNVLKVPSSALLHFKGASYLPVRVVEGLSVGHETEIQFGVHEGEELLVERPDAWAQQFSSRPLPPPPPPPKPRPSAEPAAKEDPGVYALPDKQPVEPPVETDDDDEEEP